MAHFAELDNTNKVLQIIVVDNSQEHRGQEFLAEDCNLGGRWIQTSYNANFRKNFAGIGYTYDEERDAFIEPKKYNSWILNEETCRWEPPVAPPNDGLPHIWDEDTTSWILVPPAVEEE